ncbi:ROK family transcriptional regulator [Psychromicrobium xiongbiense]|uniref:ROK family transcriptional regulator n=1 Tax=Psychromicrobium xiongbiense TaxID=3051184 RepID=UPI002555F76F|nr:ROK family transcriptional regulator [Psychromicrobium sp. YIM S02556]
MATPQYSTPAAPVGTSTGIGSSTRAGELFQIFRDGQARTRAEIAELTGLARSTVAARLEALVSLGLIGPAGEAASSGGRPPSRLAFKPSARVVFAVDVGATHVLVGLTDLGGMLMGEHRISVDVAAGPEAVLDLAIEACSELLKESRRDISELAGIGMGVPGPVEHSSGKPTNPPIMPGWDRFDIPEYVQRTFPTDVLVDNDVNIMALGERAAHWKDVDDLLFIKVATGIGSGIISGGLLQRGADGTAGDLGHVRVPRGEGVICRCGNEGCLEAIASIPALTRRLADIGISAHNGSDLLDLVRSGNVQAIQAIRQAGRDVGDVLATCVSMLNPAVVVVGGSLSMAGEHLLAGVREVVYGRSLPLATSRLRVVQSMTGREAGVIGASRMVTDHVLSAQRIDAVVGAG